MIFHCYVSSPEGTTANEVWLDHDVHRRLPTGSTAGSGQPPWELGFPLKGWNSLEMPEVVLKDDFAEVGKDEIGWKGHLLGSILNFGGLQCSLFSWCFCGMIYGRWTSSCSLQVFVNWSLLCSLECFLPSCPQGKCTYWEAFGCVQARHLARGAALGEVGRLVHRGWCEVECWGQTDAISWASWNNGVLGLPVTTFVQVTSPYSFEQYLPQALQSIPMLGVCIHTVAYTFWSFLFFVAHPFVTHFKTLLLIYPHFSWLSFPNLPSESSCFNVSLKNRPFLPG